MPNIAPDIFRKSVLIEGYYTIDVTEEKIKMSFLISPMKLSLRTYGEPIVQATRYW